MSLKRENQTRPVPPVVGPFPRLLINREWTRINANNTGYVAGTRIVAAVKFCSRLRPAQKWQLKFVSW